MLIIVGALSVVIPRSDFHDRPACSIGSHSCSNTSLAVVRPYIVLTRSNSSVTSNWLLTRHRSVYVFIYLFIMSLSSPPLWGAIAATTECRREAK